MRPVQIITDSCSDLPHTLRQELHIMVAPMSYVVEGESHLDDSWEAQNPGEFYNRMRSGAAPTTSQVSTPTFTQLFTETVKAGSDVLYIGFSSALSGTLNAATLARNSVLREYPDARIMVIDSLSASLGQGLIVYEAAKQILKGATLDEIAQWVEDHKLLMNHWFTVGDLEYLRRGGRISNIASMVGSLLQVKPVLRVDNEGRLVPWSKVRGRKKSIEELYQHLATRIVDPEGQTIAISHGDCEEEARELEAKIREHIPIGECIIHSIGPAVGSHSGPETMALFFWSHGRD